MESRPESGEPWFEHRLLESWVLHPLAVTLGKSRRAQLRRGQGCPASSSRHVTQEGLPWHSGRAAVKRPHKRVPLTSRRSCV